MTTILCEVLHNILWVDWSDKIVLEKDQTLENLAAKDADVPKMYRSQVIRYET